MMGPLPDICSDRATADHMAQCAADRSLIPTPLSKEIPNRGEDTQDTLLGLGPQYNNANARQRAND